jgi:hypothetical protein
MTSIIIDDFNNVVGSLPSKKSSLRAESRLNMDIQSITSGLTGIRAAYEAWKIISNSTPTLTQADSEYAKALLSRSLTDAIIELNDKNLKIQDLDTQLKKKNKC